jgi:hypothetical protein
MGLPSQLNITRVWLDSAAYPSRLGAPLQARLGGGIWTYQYLRFVINTSAADEKAPGSEVSTDQTL